MIRKLLFISAITGGSGLLFVASVAAILAFKGQLNREGLSSFSRLPIVGKAFPEPVKEDGEVEEGQKEDVASRLILPFPEPLNEEYLLQLITDLKNTKETLERKEDELKGKEKNILQIQEQLDELRADLGEFMAGIAAAKRELDIKESIFEEKVTVLKQEESKNIKALAGIYEAMRPEAAARSLSSLDQKTAVKILAVMDPRKSGKIFGALPPEKTVELTERWKQLKKETVKKK